MSGTPSQSVQIFCLIFGTVEGLGAALWCAAGAGIYGSPLAGMGGLELAHVWAFLLTGPLSALLAAIVILWQPRWGAAWLIAGALASGTLVSGALAAPYFTTDAHILPLALVSLPMLVIGLWLIWASARTSEVVASAEHPLEPRRAQPSHGKVSSIMLGVL